MSSFYIVEIYDKKEEEIREMRLKAYSEEDAKKEARFRLREEEEEEENNERLNGKRYKVVTANKVEK